MRTIKDVYVRNYVKNKIFADANGVVRVYMDEITDAKLFIFSKYREFYIRNHGDYFTIEDSDDVIVSSLGEISPDTKMSDIVKHLADLYKKHIVCLIEDIKTEVMYKEKSIITKRKYGCDYDFVRYRLLNKYNIEYIIDENENIHIMSI